MRRVMWGGRPLEGAQMRLAPEELFGDVIERADGATSDNGTALLAIDKSNLPADLQNLRCV